MIVIFEQDECIPAHALAEGHRTSRRRVHVWQQKGNPGQYEPGDGNYITGVWRGVDIEEADEPTTAHPTESCDCAQRTELALGIAQTGKDNGAGEAGGWGSGDGVKLQQEKNDSRWPAIMDAQRGREQS